MSRYIVRCLYNGTKKDIQGIGRNPGIALARVLVSRNAKLATSFIVYERKTNSPVLTYHV